MLYALKLPPTSLFLFFVLFLVTSYLENIWMSKLIKYWMKTVSKIKNSPVRAFLLKTIYFIELVTHFEGTLHIVIEGGLMIVKEFVFTSLLFRFLHLHGDLYHRHSSDIF